MTASARSNELDARFVRFVAANRERARRMAWRLVGGDDAAADDVTQDALVAAYAGLDRFRDEAALSTWFHRILVRQARAHRRWRAVRVLWGGLGGEGPEDAPEPTAATAQRDPFLQRRIAQALDRLPRGQREVFVLVHFEGFTVVETAQVLAKAEGTVKSHLQRALQALRAELADVIGDQTGS